MVHYTLQLDLVTTLYFGIRNTDDYGRLWLSNPHQDHIFQNLYTSLLTSHLHVIPDGDMFMSSSEAPVFHAILRALMPGPILLTDKQGQHDPALINRFVGQTRSGKQVILKTDDPVRPVQNRLFDRECREGGRGGALVGSVYLPRVKSSIIGSWNVRENHVDNRVDDWLTAQDLRDAFPDALSAEEYLIYKPGYCSDSAWAIWNLQKDKDEGQVMHITLNHLAAETVLVVPIHSAALPVGDKGDLQMVKVAVCGLVDKFAGLVGVTGMNLSSGTSRVPSPDVQWKQANMFPPSFHHRERPDEAFLQSKMHRHLRSIHPTSFRTPWTDRPGRQHAHRIRPARNHGTGAGTGVVYVYIPYRAAPRCTS